jgi:hypothetical protein
LPRSSHAGTAAKSLHAVRTAETNARRYGEMSVAAGEVIAHRMALGAQAMIDPAGADHAEFSTMITEKVAAFAQAGAASLAHSGRAASRVLDYAAAEMAATTRAAAAISRASSPAALAFAGTHIMMDWFTRAMAQSMDVARMAGQMQSAALAPIHRTATRNARRLKG